MCDFAARPWVFTRDWRFGRSVQLELTEDKGADDGSGDPDMSHLVDVMRMGDAWPVDTVECCSWHIEGAHALYSV